MKIDDIPNWIKAERRKQKITVPEMAEKVYSNVNSIYDIESSNRRVNHLTPFALTVIDKLGYEVDIQIVKKGEYNGNK